jgi:hypothetical protein
MVERRLLFALGMLAVLASPVFAGQETQYMAVFAQGGKIGYSVHTRTVEADQITTRDQMNLTIDRVGTPVAIKRTETYVETAAGKPLSFESVYEFGATTDRIAGTVGEDGTVALTVCTTGREEKHTFPWPAGALMAEERRLLLREKGLTRGTEYTAKVFEARWGQTVKEKTSIGPKKLINLLSGAMGLTEVTTVRTLSDGEQLTSTSYVDSSFRTHKRTVSMGDLQLELYACSRESALSAAAPLDLLAKMFIPSPEPIPNIESVSAITYTLTPAQAADLSIPSTDSQKATRLWNGKIALEIKLVAGPTWATFPYKGNKVTLRKATQATPYLQSDRKEVVELARQAVGNTRDTVEAVRRIESFVAHYIDKPSLSVGYASAAEVVESRQGDCSEFAVLTAALCRAVGIPAQVVVGVAYAENFAGKRGFVGHAWTQAYVGRDAQGVWVGLDAAYKRSGGGYDAGHIALAFGGDPTDFSSAAALDQLTIDDIRVQRRR